MNLENPVNPVKRHSQLPRLNWLRAGKLIKAYFSRAYPIFNEQPPNTSRLRPHFTNVLLSNGRGWPNYTGKFSNTLAADWNAWRVPIKYQRRHRGSCMQWELLWSSWANGSNWSDRNSSASWIQLWSVYCLTSVSFKTVLTAGLTSSW